MQPDIQAREPCWCLFCNRPGSRYTSLPVANAMTQKPSSDSSSTFRIRPARRGDVESIAMLMGELGYPNAPDAATVHWVLSHPEMEVIVAADSLDKPIGLITLSHRPQLRM